VPPAAPGQPTPQDDPDVHVLVLTKAVLSPAGLPVAASEATRVCNVVPAVGGKDTWLLGLPAGAGQFTVVRLTLQDAAGKTVTVRGNALLSAGKQAVVRSAPAGLRLTGGDAKVDGKVTKFTLLGACPAPTSPDQGEPGPPPNPGQGAPKPPAQQPAPPANAPGQPASGKPAGDGVHKPIENVANPPADREGGGSVEPPAAKPGGSSVTVGDSPADRAAPAAAKSVLNWTMVAYAGALLLAVAFALASAVVVRVHRSDAAS
jgi:hypothetical protein